MIRNERDYRIVKAQAERARAALADETPPPKGAHARLHRAARESLRAQLQDLDAQIESYEALKAGKSRGKVRGRLDDLGDLLTQARIARGWTQRELADRVGLHMQQIQKYEAEHYASASLTRLGEVWQALGLEATVSGTLVALPEGVPALARKK